MILIAEVKTKSPFGYNSDLSWDELFVVANNVGDWISIHTDPRWGGSLELVNKARQLTPKPILAKGIHAFDSEIDEAYAAGADHVLVVGRVPPHSDVLIEPLNLDQLQLLPGDVKAVWNARDLLTGSTKNVTFAEARKKRCGWLCQASFIMSLSDIDASADAIIVGEHLQNFTNMSSRHR